MGTHSKKARHFYQTALYLYPKPFREEYGEQMVQTLEDMLNETESLQDEIAVWLRATAEIPLQALKENINNFGESSMNKLTSVSNKRLVAGVVIIAAVIFGVAVGVLRDSIVDGLAGTAYHSSLQTTLAAQNAKLAAPFVQLTGGNPKLSNSCMVQPNSGIHVPVECQMTMAAYTKLGQSAVDKTRALAAAEAINNALTTQGYHSGSNGVTLMGLVAGTYDGKDYTPDAFYWKVVGKDTCTFDTQIAYANPAQPAVHLNLTCIRTVNILGKPSGQLFDSSKGYGG